MVYTDVHLWSGEPVADLEGFNGVRLTPLALKYPVKLKLFQFHWIFMENEIKSATRISHTFTDMNTISRYPGSTPVSGGLVDCNILILFRHWTTGPEHLIYRTMRTV